MIKPLFCDIDGCLTPTKKIWLPVTIKNHTTLSVAKEFSDHDSHILHYVRDRVIFITADGRINPEWCERHGVECIISEGHKNEEIWEYWQKNWGKRGWYSHSECAYYYLGDSMPDYSPLYHAHRAFIPSDASEWLKTKLTCNDVQHTVLNKEGGSGCLEEVVMNICQSGDWEDVEL